MIRRLHAALLFELILMIAFPSGSSAVETGQRTSVHAEKLWIFFKDKGSVSTSLTKQASTIVSERSLQRRSKVKSENYLIGISDLPVYQPYIDAIHPYVQTLRVQSKWLNAVSVEMEPAQICKLKQFDFIKELRPLKTYRRPEIKDILSATIYRKQSASNIEFDYGPSESQLAQIGVPSMHQAGFYGQNIMICVLDDGFNLLYLHDAFDSLHIAGTYDFIHDDPGVDDSGLAATDGTHGTSVLSAIGGYAPGNLIGPAFKAQYLLGKTEDVSDEYPAEEDYWVAGLEWADSCGADIVTSSLGYIDWYDWQELDGQTAVTTIVADMAVEKGMLVFNIAGNSGYSSEHNTLWAPGDGNNVLTIGAVTSSGNRVSFSSVGPTADGRIKPDLAAMGYQVYVAYPYDSTQYTRRSGTSFACPLAAGAAALLLSAYPDLTPEEIDEALRSTASQSTSPDNLLGWGIIDVQAAYQKISTNINAEHNIANGVDYFQLNQNYPNPFNNETMITYRINFQARINIDIFDVKGQRILSLPAENQKQPGWYRRSINMSRFASGIYYLKVAVRNLSNGIQQSKTKKIVLIK